MTPHDELMALAGKATPGEWRECGHARGGCVCGLVWSTWSDEPVADAALDSDEELRQHRPGPEQRAANAAFIAAACNFVRSDAFRAMVRDAARLDALEQYVAKNGGLVLHSGDVRGNHAGLGLANTGRTLRRAIDDMAGFDAAASGAGE